MARNDAAVVAAINRYRDDPVAFVQELLRAHPEPWQAEFLQNVVNYDRVAVRSANGVGKTTALSWIILWFLITRHPVKVMATAPSSDQISNALWAELKNWNGKLPATFKDFITVISDKAYVQGLESANFAVARTSSKDRPESLQGLHSENMLFVIDEASGVAEEQFTAAMSSMSTKGAKVVMCSNPIRTSGYFYDAFHKTADLWKTMKVPASASRFSRDGELIKMVTARSGVDSNEYRIQIMGEFPEGDDDGLISRSLVEAAIGRDVVNIDGPIYWGLDVAEKGGDRSALCKRKTNHLIEPVKWWAKRELMETAGMVQDEWNKTRTLDRPEEIFVDAIGVGAGVASRLKELGLPCRAINVSESPAVKERFLRLRDELWWRAKEWFEARDVCLETIGFENGAHEQLVVELCVPTWRTESNGKIRVETKNEMKQRGFKSPNLADAFCLTLCGQAQTRLMKQELKYHDKWIV